MKNQREPGKTSVTIKSRILSGYLFIVVLFSVLVAGAITCMIVVERGYQNIVSYVGQKAAAQEVITSHYKWLEELSNSILTGEPFSGSLDSDTCSLGKWIQETSPQDMNDQQMSTALEGIIQPHKEIHASASVLLDQAKTDTAAAFEGYQADVKPRIQKIGEGLTIISQRYTAISEEKNASIRVLVTGSLVLCVLLSAAAVALALASAKKISSRISEPLNRVAELSETLSNGVYTVGMDAGLDQSQEHFLEIQTMLAAFQKLVRGIQEDAAAIQRIGSGDMTVYVDVKSDGDILGQSLYRLVQTNDLMFARLLSVADSVATHSQSIAMASIQQAERAMQQSKAVEKLSSTVNQANDLAQQNAKRSSQAAEVTSGIRGQVEQGNTKMTLLLQAVQEIKASSEKISSVMKTIDDIAFQTNILALNAAVEAARAGQAGKGFAVVADEVRNLANKSAEAAKNSAALIQDSIAKTEEGNRLSQETFDMFVHIVSSTDSITGLVHEIAEASENQQQYIDGIRGEIDTITSAVSNNAAASQETAASTQEMKQNALYIQSEMKKFNLRKRESDKPYIPPEKQGDEQFIKQAYENYRRARQSGKLGTSPKTAL